MSHSTLESSANRGARFAAALYFGAVATIGVTPFISDYVLLGLGALGLGLAAIRRDALLVAPATLMIFVAPLLVLVTVAFVFSSGDDLIPFGAALLLLAAPGLTPVVARADWERWKAAFHLACLVGVTGAFLLGLGELLATGTDRVSAGNNPIHYAALSVMLGFLALPGIGLVRSAWRLVFLMGPVLAIFVTLISASRGPLVAALLLAATSALAILAWFRHDRLIMRAFFALAILAACLLAFLGVSGRALSILADLWGMVTGGPTIIDAYRMAMMQTAITTLLDAPFYGLGFSSVMPTVTAAYPDLVAMHTLHDLHNDPANFAAAAGFPGLIAYFMMVGAPLLFCRPGQGDLNLSVLLLVVAQLSLGLTNTTIGILPQTMLFCAGFAYCQARAMRGGIARRQNP